MKGRVGTSMITQRIKAPTNVVVLVKKKTPICKKCKKRMLRWQKAKRGVFNTVRGFSHFPSCENPESYIPNRYRERFQ